MKRHTPMNSGSGVTLVELLVSVVVVGILAAIAMPSLLTLIERRRVVAVAGEVSSMFAFARSEANVVGGILNLHLEDSNSLGFSCMRLSSQGGDTCQCNKALDEACKISSSGLLREYIVPSDTSVRFVTSGTFGPFGNVVAFKRGTIFNGVNDVHVDVTGIRTGAKLRVEYTNVGRVRICSPDGSIGGYVTC